MQKWRRIYVFDKKKTVGPYYFLLHSRVSLKNSPEFRFFRISLHTAPFSIYCWLYFIFPVWLRLQYGSYSLIVILSQSTRTYGWIDFFYIYIFSSRYKIWRVNCVQIIILRKKNNFTYSYEMIFHLSMWHMNDLITVHHQSKSVLRFQIGEMKLVGNWLKNWIY